MKESMHYLTNYYQLREFVLIRMLEIIKQRYYAKVTLTGKTEHVK